MVCPNLPESLHNLSAIPIWYISNWLRHSELRHGPPKMAHVSLSEVPRKERYLIGNALLEVLPMLYAEVICGPVSL